MRWGLVGSGAADLPAGAWLSAGAGVLPALSAGSSAPPQAGRSAIARAASPIMMVFLMVSSSIPERFPPRDTQGQTRFLGTGGGPGSEL